ncbi:DUF159 family protein [Agromyces rhizosphaerae]|uniref:Abasic site processing protein n=2 Tax=Agromyces rhizosphaerae TaxID=88374 RepID=A0A9W6D0R9_9MICO|nr:DUF159 family protein [Agromyces rhizosphaerae]
MDDETNDLIEAFVLDGNDFRDWTPSYSIAPTDVIPIIRERHDRATGEVRRTVEPARWDFHPSFLRDSKRPQFNARIETIATNGLWKGAFASSRCIVPMRGYYEWTGKPGDKQPHFLHGDGLLAAAGIATARKVDDEWQVSAAIITRAAKDASGEVHDRMPAFLLPDWDAPWLSSAKLDEAGRLELVEQLGAVSDQVATTIRSYEVDRRVNNSRTVDPSDATLIEPLEA